MNQLFVAWTQESWLHVQRKRQDWHFMRKSTSFVTVSGQAIYTPVEAGIPAGTFGFWNRQTLRSYNTAGGISGEIHMSYEPFDRWRDIYLFGGTRDVRTQPAVFSINQADHGLALGPVPNSDYTVTADYYEKPVAFVNGTDVPSIPDQYNMIIVYKTMMKYGAFDNAPEVSTRGAQEYAEVMRSLDSDRTNDWVMGGAIA